MWLGYAHQFHGQYVAAKEQQEQALPLLTAADEQIDRAWCLMGLGNVAIYGGQPVEAAQFYQRG